MSKGAYSLGEIGWPMVRLYWSECHRFAQFKRTTPLERFGLDKVMPSMLRDLKPCSIGNKEGRISRRHDIEAESDADAMLKAETVCAALSDEFHEIEVWREARLVGGLARQPTPGERRAG